MKLFAPSALPVEPSQARIGRILALGTGLALLAPWWQLETFVWEARAWYELMADADDPELAHRRAGIDGRAPAPPATPPP